MATLLQGAARSDVAKVTVGSVVAERYQILGELGRGGFGAVLRARHVGTGQEMALKVLSGGEADDRMALKRFFLEARATAGLRHPNTIRVFDFGQDDSGIVYLAMELLVGAPLANHLRDRVAAGQPYSEREAAEIGVTVLRSLAEAHGAGLVHRDLKPDNIFLHHVGEDEAPVIKVLDFGIAKVSGNSITGGDQILGPPAYMSPEQVRAQKIDGRSDLYSVGVILFQLVAGQLPFKGDTPISTIYMHLEAQVPDLRRLTQLELSDGFVAVVNRALSKRPDERFSSASEMRQALQACLGVTERSAPMPLPLPRDSNEAQTIAAPTPISQSRPSTRPPMAVPPPPSQPIAVPQFVSEPLPAPPVSSQAMPAPPQRQEPVSQSLPAVTEQSPPARVPVAGIIAAAVGSALAVAVLAAAGWWFFLRGPQQPTQVIVQAPPPPPVVVQAPLPAAPPVALAIAPTPIQAAAPLPAPPRAHGRDARPTAKAATAAPASAADRGQPEPPPRPAPADAKPAAAEHAEASGRPAYAGPAPKPDKPARADRPAQAEKPPPAEKPERKPDKPSSRPEWADDDAKPAWMGK